MTEQHKHEGTSLLQPAKSLIKATKTHNSTSENIDTFLSSRDRKRNIFGLFIASDQF